MYTCTAAVIHIIAVLLAVAIHAQSQLVGLEYKLSFISLLLTLFVDPSIALSVLVLNYA